MEAVGVEVVTACANGRDAIEAVESLLDGEYRVVLHDGTKLTSGRTYRRDLHAVMGKGS